MILLFLILIIIIITIGCIKIVPQANAFVIERLGAYNGTWQTGLHFLIPFIDRIARKITLKERVIDYPPQPVITKDNVTMQIDTVVYFQVTDPKLYTYGVENPLSAIEKLTATTLRNIIGELELDETLTSRDLINGRMRVILDEATDPWGIKVNRVEVKNIMPPRDIQEAMEKQMRAERERRESILKAEGEKKSSILIAEGEKQARILQAEGEKQARILQAEGLKESRIREAEGEAQAILNISDAKSKGLELLKSAQADASVISLKSLETMEKVADGKATKIIIPSELQSLAGLTAGLTEIAETAKEKTNK